MSNQQEVSPFTYFIGPGGVTFCCERLSVVPGSQDVHSSTIYYPKRTAVRKRWTTNQRQERMIFDGTPADSQKISDPFSPIPEILRTFSRLYAMTGEQIISIPISHIDTFFDPRDSLEYLISGCNTVPEEVFTKVTKVVKYLTDRDLPYSILGIYGSLQTFLVQEKIRDVDICIYGLEHASLLQRIVSKYWAVADPVDFEQWKNRPLPCTVYPIPNLAVDFKLLRLPEDRLSYTPDICVLSSNRIVEGVVIDTLEAYSTPMSYKILDPAGEIITVSCSRFNFGFFAMKGSYIRVTASQTNFHNHIVLADAKKHRVEHIVLPHTRAGM